MLTFLALALGQAAASTTSGYVISVTYYNSGYSTYACDFTLGSAATSTSGISFTVDDVSGKFSATCTAAMIASYTDDKLYVDYASSGGKYMVSGVYASTTSGALLSLFTNGSTGTTSADRCSVLVNSSGGLVDLYVDDSGPEEDMMCTMLALRHFTNSGSGSYSASSNEIMYYTMKF